MEAEIAQAENTYSSIQNKPHPFQGRSQIQKESPLEQTPGEQFAAKKTIRKDKGTRS